MLSSVSRKTRAQWQNACSLIVIASLSLCPVLVNSLLSTKDRPNIVVFLADDLGIGDVGCFGNDTIKTPNIDRIAREGAKLTHHLAAEALCTPSRAALLTGRYPVRSGMAPLHDSRVCLFASSACGLPSNETTFAEVAKKHGYTTALIGKWHLGLHSWAGRDFLQHPNKQGFDYYYGLPLSNMKDFADDGEGVILSHLPNMNRYAFASAIGGLLASLYIARTGVLPRLVIFPLVLLFVLSPVALVAMVKNMKTENAVVMRNLEPVEQPVRFINLTQRLVAEGLGFLERSRGDNKPFLLMMSWIQVHTVLHTADEFRGRSKHGQYGDNVEEMDWSVGEILSGLERLGVMNNTFVYFTSDNGGHLEEIGHTGNQEGGWNGIYRGSKGQGSMDGGIRMPTVAMWRGKIQPGTVIDAPTSLMDLFPTLSALLSEPLPEDRIIDGRNIYPLLTGASKSSPHRFLMHYCATDLQAVRYVPEKGNGDVYKLYYATPNWLPGSQTCDGRHMCLCRMSRRHNPPLLYNIGKDPAETRQLSVEDHADIVQLINEAVQQHQSSVSPDIPSQFGILDMLPRFWLQPCCNFPRCDCVDPVYANVTSP